jgi:hypothetical protein
LVSIYGVCWELRSDVVDYAVEELLGSIRKRNPAFGKQSLPRIVRDMVDAKVRKGSNYECNSFANLLGHYCDQQHLPMDDMGDREFLLISA